MLTLRLTDAQARHMRRAIEVAEEEIVSRERPYTPEEATALRVLGRIKQLLTPPA